MKEIEKYIQFAIDNGYNGRKDMEKAIEVVDVNYIQFQGWILEINYRAKDKEYMEHSFDSNLYETITSKEFIEAIAKGYIKNNEPTKYGEVEGIGDYKSDNGILYMYDEIVYQITTLQAIAISNKNLEEFINNLLPNEQKSKHTTK